MAIRLISDIHLEFQDYEVPPLDTDSEDILVCAGDIGVGLQGADWVSSMADRFRAIVYVAGNHEFYKGNYTRRREYLRDYKWPENVHYLDGDKVEIDDFVIIGATLWTDNDRGDPNFGLYIRRRLNDYSYIHYDSGEVLTGQHIFTPEYTSKLHEKDVDNIVNHLSNICEGDKVIVVTHHLPSFQCVHPDYRGSRINPAYASNLDDIIYYYQPDLWLYGHSHKTYNVKIGSTVVRNNPRGYYMDSRGENVEFNPYLRLGV